MAPDHNSNNVNQELFDDWVCACVCCCKSTSPTRPPNYNPSNCPCSQSGTPFKDPHLFGISNGMNSVRLSSPSEVFQYHQATTVTSDGDSVRGQEGIETKDPNVIFLRLAPETGLGEVQHRRRASFDEVEVQLDYGIRRYLETLTPLERSYHGSGRGWEEHNMETNGGSWLRQDAYLVGPTGGGGGYSVQAAKGSSKESVMSTGYLASRSSECHIDLFQGSGGWMDANVVENWPDTLIIDEYAVDSDGDDE